VPERLERGVEVLAVAEQDDDVARLDGAPGAREGHERIARDRDEARVRGERSSLSVLPAAGESRGTGNSWISMLPRAKVSIAIAAGLRSERAIACAATYSGQIRRSMPKCSA
jgi:hypothetical protein